MSIRVDGLVVKTIDQAYAAISTAGTIIVDDGTIISGAAGNGAGKNIAWYVDGATFSNNARITTSTGSLNMDGVAMRISADSVVKKVLFSGNTHYVPAGGSTGGAAIAVVSGSTMTTLSGCTFVGNTTTNNGAAIAHLNGHLSISGSTFSKNTAQGTAGAIIVGDGAVLDLDDVVFDGNSAYHSTRGTISSAIRNGGTINVKGLISLKTNQRIWNLGVMSIDGASFISGDAPKVAKAIDADGIWFHDLDGNHPLTTTAGYNIFTPTDASDYDWYVTNCAIGSADAIVTDTGFTYLVSGNTVFLDDASKHYATFADAFSAGKKSFVLNGTLIDGGSTTTVSGGANYWAIYGANGAAFTNTTVALINSASHLHIEGMTFSGNGGDAIINNGAANSVLTIKDSLFAGNTNRLGVVRNDSGVVRLAGVTFANNVGTQNGTSTFWGGTVDIIGTVYFGANQLSKNTAKVTVIGGSFITAAGGVQAAKVIDGTVGTAHFNVAPTVDDSTNYKLFTAGSNDTYITQAGSALASAAIVSPAGDVGAVVVNDTVYSGSAYTTLSAAMASASSTVALSGYTVTSENFDGSKTLLVDGGLTFANTGTLNFAADLSDVAVSVLRDPGDGAFTVFTGASGFGSTVTVNGVVMALGTATAGNGSVQLAEYTGGALTVSVSDTIYIASDHAADGFKYFQTLGDAYSVYGEMNLLASGVDIAVSKYDVAAYNPNWTAGATPASVVVNGETVALTYGKNAFNSLADAQTVLANDGTLVFAGYTTASEYTVKNVSELYVTDVATGVFKLRTGNNDAVTLTVADSSVNVIRTYSVGDSSDFASVTIDASKTTVTGASGEFFIAQTVGDADITMKEVTLPSSLTIAGGASVVGGDLNITMRDCSVTAGNFYLNKGVVGGDINATFVNVQATKALSLSSSASSGIMVGGNVIYNITDSTFNGVYGGGSSDQPTIDGNISITLTNSLVTGEDKGVTGSRGNNVNGSIFVTLAGSTVSTIRKHDDDRPNVTAKMTVTVTGASASSIGSMVDVDALVIDSGARADFKTAQALNAVALTVDGSAYVSSEVTVATGVSSIGGYEIVNAVRDDLFLKVEDGNLKLYARAADLADGTTTNLIGNGSVYMTGGTITNILVGTNSASGSARSVITGGVVDNALVGGKLVAAGSSAALDAVMLELDGGRLIGGTANGGMNYVAGYVYGDNSALPDAPNYTVAKATVTLAGATVDGNLYAGAHARKYGYASVGETSVTVTDGYCNKLYGGGWAERGNQTIEGGTAALSKVGSATIEISGGTVEYVYAGGGNSYYGYTEVGNADIKISGGKVDYVFLAGRNINCSVTGNATLTISGTAQELIRVSGRNGSGQAMTETSVLNVETNVTLGYLDYVDVINLSEKCLLDAANVIYESGSAATLNFVTDGFTGDWDAVSGEAYDVFQSAKFQVNGVDVVRDATTGDLGDSGYRLTFDGDNRKFILNQIA